MAKNPNNSKPLMLNSKANKYFCGYRHDELEKIIEVYIRGNSQRQEI
ncbi:hypothetical protein HMPREF3224_01409 [Anaerococcus hydrogenalis]|nr:hypothetical protein HMPREF3224_01409 [Anaerococcus hydrogenalis]